jgi:hypothetical protein
MDSCIVKIVTDKGVRLGVDYTESAANDSIVHRGLSFEYASDMIKQVCVELGLEEFDNNNDDFLGYVSDFVGWPPIEGN